MNKIVMDKEYYHLDNENLNIKITKRNISLEISGNVKINDFDTIEDINLSIVLNDNSKLIYNKFNKDINSVNVDIKVNNNCYLEFNQSVYNCIEGKFKINTKILGNNSDSKINFYGVTNHCGNIIVDVTGDVKDNIKDNNMLENVRLLSLNDAKNVILPNLLVSSNDVIVNHNATISKIDDDYLFYLTSKGLSKESAINLIYKGFIFSKLNISDEEKNLINI